jgi:K+-transporting ATPase c subunit
VLLTIMWVLVVLALTWRLFGIGLEQWSDQQSSEGSHADELDRKAYAALLLLIGAAVGGPVLIAIVAFIGRMAVTGAVYVALAVILGAFALPVAGRTHREPPPLPSPGPAICQEHSGSDTRCPGG